MVWVQKNHLDSMSVRDPVLSLASYHRQESWAGLSPEQTKRAGPGGLGIEQLGSPAQLPPRPKSNALSQTTQTSTASKNCWSM